MSDAKSAWKAKAVHQVTLDSGQRVGLALPSIRDCLIEGDIPLSVVDKMQKVVTETKGKKATPASELTIEDLKHDAKFQSVMVARCVRTVGEDEEPVTLSVDDVADLPGEDRDEIWAYASRVKPLPKAS